MSIRIESRENALVKRMVRLSGDRKYRRDTQEMVCEGGKMLEEALLSEIEIHDILIADNAEVSTEYLHQAEQQGARLHSCPNSLMQKISNVKTPQGILFSCERPVTRLETLRGDRFIVLEGLQDPGNLGTIMRTGEGAGISGVILSRTSVDIYNPKTIRSTMGSIYRVPFLYVDSIQEILPRLKAAGIRTYAAHLQGKRSYDKENYQKGTAFLIGNEGNGLTPELSACADCLIQIPMKGQVESLNAAMAGGILMYEAARQRRG